MDTCATNIEHHAVQRLHAQGPCLDAVQVGRIREAWRRALSTGAQGIVIDLERIERIDPLGLSALAVLLQDGAAHGRIALSSLKPLVQEAALLVHLHEIVDIYEDPRAAILDLSLQIGQP